MIRPERKKRIWNNALLIGCSLLLIAGLHPVNAAYKAGEEEYPVARPPLTPGIFPCSSCHGGMDPNPKKREVKEEHTNIRLHHAENLLWCLSCHDTKDRDKLRLVNGDLIDFTESYRLCGECHGTQFRDWKAGIHGKRIGYFNGARTYYLCVNCHNPHDPKFQPLKPEPPPFRQG
jgi:hypothetical protein